MGIVLSSAARPAEKGVAVVGEVATGIPLPSLPSIGFGDIVFLLTGAFGIVFLALAESIGAARSFAVRHRYDIDPDQELIALGASNAAAGLFGGFAVDASLSQSATGEAAGNRTQLASLVTAALVLATAIVLAPIFANLPLSVLSAIVIASVVSLVNLAELRRYWAWKRTDFLLAVTRPWRRDLHDRPDRDGHRGHAVADGHPVPRQPAVPRGARPRARRPAGLRRRGSPPDRRAGRRVPHAAAQRPAHLRQRRCREGPGHGPGSRTSRTGRPPSSSTSAPPPTSTWRRPTC